MCGLDFAPTAATLPSPDALAAAEREHRYFEAHPELLAAQEARQEVAEREREREEHARLSKMRPAGFAEYRDVSWRARLARGWLVVVAGLTVLGGALEIGHLRLLDGKTTAELDLALAQRIDDSNATLATVYLITFCAYLFSTVFFVAWTHRAYKNATALGAQRPRFGAGWAIGGWFVPVLAFWRPKQIVNDIWRASNPDDAAVVTDWHGRAVPALLTAWWATFLISAISDRISARIPADTVEDDRIATSWALTASFFTVLAAFFAIAVVSHVTRRQRARAAKLAQLPAAA